jgi:hypothetical protein
MEHITHDFECGGTLVAKDVVLTAPHCIDVKNRKSASVQIKGEEIKVKEFIIHPRWWNAIRDWFAFALVVLERPTTQDIKLIRLNSDENFPAPNSLARVMGWGYTDANKTDTDVAFQADVNLISNAECAAKWADKNVTIGDYNICTFEQGQGGYVGGSGEIELS